VWVVKTMLNWTVITTDTTVIISTAENKENIQNHLLN